MLIVHLGRDREGEDTHQNIVHETVLSFGRFGHLIYFTHKKSLIVNNLNLHSLKSYANSNQNSMLASFFSYCFFNSPPLELVPWMIELYFLQLITSLFFSWFQMTNLKIWSQIFQDIPLTPMSDQDRISSYNINTIREK